MRQVWRWLLEGGQQQLQHKLGTRVCSLICCLHICAAQTGLVENQQHEYLDLLTCTAICLCVWDIHQCMDGCKLMAEGQASLACAAFVVVALPASPAVASVWSSSSDTDAPRLNSESWRQAAKPSCREARRRDTSHAQCSRTACMVRAFHHFTGEQQQQSGGNFSQPAYLPADGARPAHCPSVAN